jgi:hypothetical protein
MSEGLNLGIGMHDSLKADVMHGSFSVHPMSVVFKYRFVLICALSF